MGRESDRTAGVGDATLNRLADPPRRVRRELEALAPVELLDRVHQPEVALLHEVEEGKPRRLVLLGDRDHQPQVGLDELAASRLAPQDRFLERAAVVPLDAAGLVELGARVSSRVYLLGQAGLVVLGEELVSSDLV